MSKSGLLISQFSTESGPGAWMIRYLSNSPISHVDLVMPDGSLLGARLSGGVQVRPANYAKFTRTIRLGCMVPDIEAGYAFALDQLGKGYDSGAIADMFLHQSRPFRFDAKTWFCDELNYAIYWKAGVKLLNTDDPLNLSPEEELLSPDFSPQALMASVQLKFGCREIL